MKHDQEIQTCYIKYWESYLTRRWKIAGTRAFLLRQKLAGLDKRKVTGSEFTNWSPGFEMTYEELGELISVNHTAITGRNGHCQKYEDDRRFGQPRGHECCGRHEQAGCRIEKGSRSGKLHCYFWRPGVLEVLDTEKMIAIASSSLKRRHPVRFQIWRSLSILTPFQAAWLPKCLQDEHKSWLIENASRLGWNVDAWLNTPDTVETFIDRNPDYEVGRIYFEQFQPNPYA